MKKKEKILKEETLSTRVSKKLRQEFEALCELNRRDPSLMLRILVEEAVWKQTKF